MDLARRGMEVLVAELRHRGERPSVKCNHISARSMETFRQLGIAEALRNAGLPGDYPHDVAYRTSFLGLELSRIRIPSRAERADPTIEGPDTWWPTPEPPHRINQVCVEPILFRRAEGMSNIRILRRTHATVLAQDATGITAILEDLDTGAKTEVQSYYLVGCYGGRLGVRKFINSSLHGVDVVARVQATVIDAPELLSQLSNRPAWATFGVNPRRCENVYAIDGKSRWLVPNYLQSSETDFDAVDRDWAVRQILGVNENYLFEVVSKEDWLGRRLVADRSRNGRVFICGDAAHLWVPMADYGMNAGIADAMNLAARLQGWGGDAVLDSYEAERQPITEQISQFAMDHSITLQAKREVVPKDIERQDAQGDVVRARFGKELYDLNVQQYFCAGLNFGYFYADSPLIAHDEEAAPSYGMASFTPSTVPGCRTPHVWLEGNRSLYDEMGDRFTLLRTDPGKDVSGLLEAALDRGVPLQVLNLRAQDTGGVYSHALVLSRPNRHVAWRGNDLPTNSYLLVDRVRGALH